MFADTDFILAIIKYSDWLKNKAAKILKENRNKISTSLSVMIEIALVCKRLKMNVLDAFTNIFEIITVDEETYAVCMRAAVYIEKYDLGVFDSFNAASCGDDKIISSDSAYDRIGIERMKLET